MQSSSFPSRRARPDRDIEMDMTPSVPEPSMSSTLPSHLRSEATPSGSGILLDRTESFDTAAELEIKLKDRTARSKSKPRSGNRVRLNSTPVQVSHARDSRVSGPSTPELEVEPARGEDGRTDGWDGQEKTRIDLGSSRPISSETPVDKEKAQRVSPSASSPSTKDSKPPAKSEEDPNTDPKPKTLWRKGLDRFTAAFWANRHVAWIWPKMKDWNEMKPVIRCAVAAWIGFVFLLIYPVEQAMGQAAFFALIVAFIAPPNLPFIQALEQIFFLFFFVGLAWAWVVLAGLCVNRARTGNYSQSRLQANQEKYAYLQETDPTQYGRRIIFEGSYIEAGPAIICGAFLGVGCAFYAWLKIHTQPAPFTFALVLGCVLMDVSLTIMHLFPYSYLTSGLLFMLPMSIQLGLAVLCSIFVFPESVGSSFTRKMDGVLKPIMSATDDLKHLFDDVKQSRDQRLELDRSDSDPTVFGSDAASLEEDEKTDKKRENLIKWAKTGACIREKFINSGAGLGPLKGQEHYLAKELAFSRYSGTDIQELFVPIQNVQLRSAGLSFFFDVLASAIQHTHLNSQAFNVADSRPVTPVSSRPASLHEERRSSKHVVSPLADDHHDRESSTPLGSPSEFAESDEHDMGRPDLSTRSQSYSLRKRLHLPFDWHRSSGSHGSPRTFSFGDKVASHTSLMDHLRKNQAPVGIFESMKYLEMERSQGGDVDHVTQEMELLAVAVEPLIEQLRASMGTASTWLSKANKDRSLYKAALSIVRNQAIKSKPAEEREEHRQSMKMLEARLNEFRTHDRLKIIEPYRHLLDPSHPPSDQFDYKKLKHRALFWGFLFSYHISEFSGAVLEVLQKQEALDELRPKASFWWPTIPFTFTYFARKQAAGGEEGGDVSDDTDPDHTLNDASEPLLGQAKRRDPDTMPFDSPLLNGLRYLDKGLAFWTKPEALFALKAGLLTVAVAAPAYVPNTAGFWYYNRALWCLVMAQLTLAVNSGDTIAAFLQRLQASFWGCLVGLVLWYISSGSGMGNRYGLGAVTAVAFIPLMSLRVLWGPGTPLVSILFTVSAGLVVGYSWINTSLFQATDVTYGWSTAWRRFVTVIIGTTAAMIVSQLPPVQSGKRQIRLSYSSTISQIGNVLCDVLSEMHDPHRQEEVPVRDKVLALKRKLAKLGARHATIGFEVSLRGMWPAARYQALQDVCVDLVGLLSQLNHVSADMPYVWKRAVLQRTRLSDSQFIGDLLAVISMCASALKSGTPLPQVTPGPLVERLFSQGYGLEVVSGRWDEDASLPKHVTVDVLESDEYLRYAISATCIFSIVRRFDRLLLVLKTIVGEEFHLDHLDMMERYA